MREVQSAFTDLVNQSEGRKVQGVLPNRSPKIFKKFQENILGKFLFGTYLVTEISDI